jgi:DNA modification methylase
MMDCLNFQIQGKSRICNVLLYPENNLRLKELTLEPFDIIICDGPYGILEPACEWDDFDLNTRIGRDRFRHYYRNLFDACLRHLKDSGTLFVFNYPDGASIIKNVLDDEYPVHFRRWLSWTYDNHFDYNKGTNFRRSHETILYYTRKPDGFIFHSDGLPDVLSHPISKSSDIPFKDGAKPLEVINQLLNVLGQPADRLLSLFAGSGTDIIAAINHDMEVVGFEVRCRNMDLLIERICSKIIGTLCDT